MLKHAYAGMGSITQQCPRCKTIRYRPAGMVPTYKAHGDTAFSPVEPACERVLGLVDLSEPSDWLDCPIAMFDVETTGLEHAQDRIIEVGVVTGRITHAGEFVVEDAFGTLVNPERPVTAEIEKLTNISAAALLNAPTFREVAPTLLPMLGDVRAVVAYNAPFDQGFLLSECVRAGFIAPHAFSTRAPALIDPLVWGKAKAKGYGKGANKLGPMAKRLGVEVPSDLHRADVDALLAGRVCAALSKYMPRIFADLVSMQTILRGEQDVDFHSYLMRKRAEERGPS